METGKMTMKLDEDFNFICDMTPQELLRLSELLDNFTEWYDCLYTPFIGGAFDEDLSAPDRGAYSARPAQAPRRRSGPGRPAHCLLTLVFSHFSSTSCT